jgi:ATP-dependent Clp protease protease subunit
MQTIVSDIKTVGVGLCASMGAFLLSSGTKGKRYCLPSSRVMVHMVSSGTEGTVVDQEIALENAKTLNDYLYERLAIHCGKTSAQLKDVTQRDKWMSAEESVKFGIIDKVMNYNEKKWKSGVSEKISKKSS